MNGFLYALYHFLKVVVLTVQRVFYPFTRVLYRDRLKFDGPGIIVSNHPNTLTDPLHTISRSSRLSFFLVNANLYENPIMNWLLTRLYTIPIKRPGKDNGQRAVNNAESFAKSYEHIGKGGVIYIAPEGGSEQERRLQAVKTGTARILLGAEEQYDFQLNSRIVPVGLNYEHPSNCGSRLLIQVGEPIFTKDWQLAYQEDSMEAVRDLTNTLAQRMQDLILHTEDEAQDRLLYRLQTILQNDSPQPVEAHFSRSHALLVALKELQQSAPAQYQQLEALALDYRSQLRNHGLSDRGLTFQHKRWFTPLTILGAPIWLYGRINHLLPFEIPRLLEQKMGLYKGYSATVKILSGMILFPLFYVLQYKLVSWYWEAPWPLVYLLSLPIAGIAAWGYLRYLQPRLEGRQFRLFRREHAKIAAKLEQQRGELKTWIEELTLPLRSP